MAQKTASKALRFRAGEVGFVFYEENSGPFGMAVQERTYAFGTIGDAANWLVTQFADAAPEKFGPQSS